MCYSMVERILNFIVVNLAALYGKLSRKKYLRLSKKGNKVSEKLLLKLVRKNKNTEIGKMFNFKIINSICDYQDIVPYTLYEDYKHYIDSTIETGRQKLITNDKINYFAHTSGTMGVTKMIPVVKKSYTPYAESAAIFIYNLKKEYKRRFKGAFKGKGLNLIETESELTESGIRTGFISGFAISSSKVMVPHITCLPKYVIGCGEKIDMQYIKARYALQDKNLIFLMGVFMSSITDLMNYIEENYKMLIKDIETGKINRKIKMPDNIRKKLEKKLRPDYERAVELKDIFRKRGNKPLVPLLWPKMSLVISICTGEFSPFETKMRNYCGNDIAFCYSMYASSESLIASSMEIEDKNYLILPNSGFYEFIDIENENSKPLLMDELEVGKLYEIVVTNLSGLYRYRIKDVIKVTGYNGKTPTIQFAYRKEQVINISGVHLTIEHMEQAIKSFEKEIGTDITDYSVYINTDCVPSRLELFIETDKSININKNKMADIFDLNLTEVNHEYGRMLKVSEADKSVVRQVKKGTYAKYRKNKIKKGIPVNQIKTVRFINKKQDLNFFLNS